MDEVTPSKFLNPPTPMVKEIASGIEEGWLIAKKYGYTEEEWERLKVLPSFIRVVETVKSELDQSGQTFRSMSRLMAEKLLANTYQYAMGSDVPVKDKIQALQQISRLADLEPKNVAQVGNQSGFSITINIPAMPKEEAVVVEEAETKEVESTLTLNFASSTSEESVKDDCIDSVEPK